MKLLPQVLVIVFFVAINHAKPRYVAVPWNYVQLMERSRGTNTEQSYSTSRLRRDTSHKTPKYEVYQPVAQASQFEQQNYNVNPNEYVDYGAHTGNSGSFGWYADFPVH